MATKRIFKTGSERSYGSALRGIFEGIGLAENTNSNRRSAINDQNKFALEAAKAEQATAVFDPKTGNTYTIPGMTGYGIGADGRFGKLSADANPGSKSSKLVPSPNSGAGSNSDLQQTSYVDTDGTPLGLIKSRKGFIRLDGTETAPKGTPTPMRGNNEAVSSSSKGAELLPKIDVLFDRLEKKGEVERRISMIPGIGSIIDPLTKQIISEARQAGFAFGGKNYTGTEKGIIEGAMIPNSLDNKESLVAKRAALKGYVSGQMDLAQAANLLGPSGQKILDIIEKHKKDAPDASGGAERGTKDAKVYVVGKTYKMGDGSMATYLGNGEFE